MSCRAEREYGGRLADYAEPSASVPRFSGRNLRRVVVEQCGYDPGFLEDELSLEEVDLVGANLYQLVRALETLFRIDFPTDLIASFETIGDVVYYTIVKIDQAATEP